MVRTVPNTSSRRTITRYHPHLSSPSPAPGNLVNRNNLNRFFDQTPIGRTSQKTPSQHHHHQAYPSASPSLSAPSNDSSCDPIQPANYSMTTQNSSAKSVTKSRFLGVLIPKYSPLIEKPSGLRRRHKALLSKMNSVHQSSSSLSKHLNQAVRKRTTGKPRSTKKKLKKTDVRSYSICHDSSIAYPENEVVNEEQFDAMLKLNEVVVDHQRFREGDAVFVVPDEEDIPEDSQPDRYWLALIKEIKQRRPTDYHPSARDPEQISRSEVFLKVEWFYRIDDFEDSMKSNPVFRKVVEKLKKIGFRSNQHKLKSNDFRFQDKELIRTDHSSIIHINSLAGQADVYKFDDQVPPGCIKQPVFTRCCWQVNQQIDDDELESIGVENYYYRLYLRFHHQPKTRQHSRKNSKGAKGLLQSINLLPNNKYGCKCSNPYDPHKGMMIFDFTNTEWVHLRCLTAQMADEQGTDKTGIHHIDHPGQTLRAQRKQGQEQTNLLQIKSSLLELLNSSPSTSSSYPTSSTLSHFFNNQLCCLLRGSNYSLAGQFY
ncbi:hypothetical protein PtA15_8A365 [Puccinia triticina]|uniref:BAH domain-containing protein n=1 Tax=Puccinia triticina TaxID=208348 RepID=A0ABY7CTK9_9BASI|nr:uncharacterized protein PtA15_8A365 [Puccinia triticina]WAQ87461.1 hypothetical protein PtA15_8A365 [Puccinia triticina]WAR57319.1 hypothetical protein PtB15_8B366 [Puccinia triticina]